jgi:2-furoyl-CoA dehydrogenase FAD binding subunit
LAWPELARHQPLLAQALPWLGHWQTRARGTVCGSIALGDPSAELPLCLLALGGNIVLSSSKGRRPVKAKDFFTGLMSTARRDDELIESVSFPCARPGEGYAFREFARRHGDFAIVACAVIATEKGIRLAVGGVADRPVVRDFGDASNEALAAFAAELDALDDLHATADYRRILVRKLGAQAIAEARACRA